MEQYKKSGPRIEPVIKENRDLAESVKELEKHIARQDRLINELERDLRKLRNDMRMAIATFNTINSNNRRNG